MSSSDNCECKVNNQGFSINSLLSQKNRCSNNCKFLDKRATIYLNSKKRNYSSSSSSDNENKKYLKNNRKLQKKQIIESSESSQDDSKYEHNICHEQISLTSDLSDISNYNPYNLTPLHNAVQFKSYNVIKKLLDEGADANAKDSEGWTPLHDAMNNSRGRMICSLLLDYGADINLANDKSKTPLFYGISTMSIRDLKYYIYKRNFDPSHECCSEKSLLDMYPKKLSFYLNEGTSPEESRSEDYETSDSESNDENEVASTPNIKISQYFDKPPINSLKVKEIREMRLNYQQIDNNDTSSFIDDENSSSDWEYLIINRTRGHLIVNENQQFSNGRVKFGKVQSIDKDPNLHSIHQELNNEDPMYDNEPIYHSLVECNRPISEIIVNISLPTKQKKLENQLKFKEVSTIGDLSRLTISEIQWLKGIKPPNNVSTIKTALIKFEESISKKILKNFFELPFSGNQESPRSRFTKQHCRKITRELFPNSDQSPKTSLPNVIDSDGNSISPIRLEDAKNELNNTETRITFPRRSRVRNNNSDSQSSSDYDFEELIN